MPDNTPTPPVFQAHNLAKIYRTGEVEVVASKIWILN